MLKVVLALVFSIGSVSAAFADYAAVDKRIRTEPLDYRIGFCSRLSDGNILPTHAFVIYTRAEPGQSADFMLATGWAPAAGKKFTTNAVVGAFSEEILTDRSQNCLPVLVNSEAWQAALDAARAVDFEEVFEGDIDQLAERFSVYRLLENDCITFVQSIAGQIGLKVPDRGAKRPVDYIPELAKANGA